MLMNLYSLFLIFHSKLEEKVFLTCVVKVMEKISSYKATSSHIRCRLERKIYTLISLANCHRGIGSY